MPTSSDEVGQVLERNLSRALGDLARTLWRNHLRQKAAESGIVEEAAGAATPENSYSIIAFKDAETASAAAELIQQSPDWPPSGSGPGLVAVRREFVALPKAALSEAAAILDKEGIPFAVAVEEVTMDTVRSEVAGREWDAVTLTEELTGAPLAPELVDRVESVLAAAHIDYERTANVLVFHASDRQRIIGAVDRAMGKPVRFEEVAAATRVPALRGDATDKQLARIKQLADAGTITDEELANFSLSQTKQAAHELITSKVGVEGWIDHGDPGLTLADKTAEIKEAGPQIARDAQAAQRREDIGNVETTAEYVQARPNAGDQDRSTPYPDQCDAPGAGDANGNGIRDAAEDRDGDGLTDDVDPDSNPPVEKYAAEKGAEARAREAMPKNQGRDVALQVETR